MIIINRYKKILISFLFILSINIQTLAQEHFPTPDVIKDNVDFWIKIYTETSMKEGLLHDRDYPLIIFKKMKMETKVRRQRNRIIKTEKAKVKILLENILSKNEANLTKEETRILSLYKKYATKERIADAYDRIRFQQGQKERYKEGLYRSGAYLDSIRTIFKSYGLPERLIYLPHVESSFDPTAYSKVGAAGLWQFMRSTGKRYMTINYSIDERRDPLIAAVAAAKLLSHNFNSIEAWPLAITAYNHGLAGMKRAVKKTGSKDIGIIIEKHTSSSFQFASKNFYSCFIAASQIAMNPSKYFTDIKYAAPIEYNLIETQYYLRPKTITQYTGISIKELKRLNPSIRSVIFSQNSLIPKNYMLKIPKDMASGKTELALADIPDELKIITPPRPTYYKVQRGDNLYAIASRLKVSARDIAAENNINKMNRIYAGQVLRIPGAAKTVKTKKVALQEPKKLVVAKKETVEVKKKPKPAFPDSLDEIFSAKADTLPEFKVELKGSRAFRFDGDIYDFSLKFPTTSYAKIKVSVNETLGHYADWLSIPTWQIRRLNRMGRRSTIIINQTIKIPVTAENADHFTQKRVEYHMAMEEDFYSSFKVSELKRKEIKRGETLWQISNNSEGTIPLWLLKKHNKHLDLSKLYSGMVLWLPIIAERTDEPGKDDDKWRGIYPVYCEPMHDGFRPGRLIP